MSSVQTGSAIWCFRVCEVGVEWAGVNPMKLVLTLLPGFFCACVCMCVNDSAYDGTSANMTPSTFGETKVDGPTGIAVFSIPKLKDDDVALLSKTSALSVLHDTRTVTCTVERANLAALLGDVLQCSGPLSAMMGGNTCNFSVARTLYIDADSDALGTL